jgi:NADPH2:quinone reductase
MFQLTSQIQQILCLTKAGEAATLNQINAPVPAKGEALVQIYACGLNFADLLMAEGRYQERPDLPFTPGLEFAGRVLSGDGGFPSGCRVAGFAGQGGLAEFATIPAERLVAIPETMSMEQAAGFVIAYGTSHLALSHRAALRPGETLLVLGAAGGVGLTAVEIGKKIGARVIACARGAERLAVARAAGADLGIDSDSPDLKAALKSLGGIDVVYDPVGGPAFDAALRATRPEGRLLTIGFASGQVPAIPANLLLVKNLNVMGLYWGGYLRFRPDLLTASLRQLLDWFAEGGLHPHIGRVLAMEDLPLGLDLLKSRAATGKIVIRIRDDGH